ncbi:MAG: LysE family transporter [Geothermobacteraceae bacterium]
MDTVSLQVISFLSIFTLAIVSPGPNFVLVSRTALVHSRRSGLFTAFGVATGSGLFALAGLTGALVVVNSYPGIARLWHWLGGGYLIWLGLTMVFRRSVPAAGTDSGAAGKRLDDLKAWRLGLFTNLTNPKAWAFYLSLFTLVAQPGISMGIKIGLNLAMFAISLAWYSLVAALLGDARLSPLMRRIEPALGRVLGLVLVTFGIRLVRT